MTDTKRTASVEAALAMLSLVSQNEYVAEQWAITTSEPDCKEIGPYIYQNHVGGVLAVPVGSPKKSGELHLLQFILEMKKALTNPFIVKACNAYEANQATIKELREGLEEIAGKRQCPDNLMGNVDIAHAALKKAGVE